MAVSETTIRQTDVGEMTLGKMAVGESMLSQFEPIIRNRM